MDDTGIDTCPLCWSPTADTGQWILLSQHRTSEGEVEYCLSTCGCVAILLNGDLLKSLTEGESPPAVARHHGPARPAL